MYVPLSPNVCATLHGRDMVLLDLASGQYDLLAGAGVHLQLSDDRRSVWTSDAGLARELQAMGLLGAETTVVGRRIPPHPGQGCLDGAEAKVKATDRLAMAVGWAGMLTHFHGRTIQQLLAEAAARTPGAASATEAEIVRRAQVFDALSVWTPFQGECLYRCNMLLRVLGRSRYRVDWVFGVRTWPFLAHCWLQLGDVSLTDPAERLAMFSPILAV